MNEVRHNFFTGTVRTCDQHARFCRRYLIYNFAYACDSRTLADHLRTLGSYLFAELFGLLLEVFRLQSVLGRDKDTVEIQRFQQKIIRA